MSRRWLEFEGSDRFVDGAEALLTSRDIDAVVIRRLFGRRQLRRLRAESADRHRVLREAVDWKRFTNMVTDWWAANGYTEYQLVMPLLMPGNRRTGPLASHLDPPEGDGALYGPLSMSVVTGRTAGEFRAERTSERLVTADGSFDAPRFAAMLDEPEVDDPGGRPLRTSVPQGRGDAVLFTNHPEPTYHGVDAPADREAQLFESLVVPAG